MARSRKKQKKKPDVQRIVRDLKDERFTPRDVARKYRLPLKKIYEISSRYQINLHKKVKPKHREVINNIQDRNLTLKEAAERANVSESVVEYVCQKYGLKPARPVRYPLLRDDDWLYKKLVEEQRTYREVADMIGCTYQRVQQRTCELGWQKQRRRRKNRSKKGNNRRKKRSSTDK